MKPILKFFVVLISSAFGGRYAGKLIGMFDFCRQVVCNNKRTFAGKIHERMDLSNMLPNPIGLHSYHSIEPTTKIKVRILYPAGCSWNNIHTLYDAFVADDRYQTYVIVENYPRFINIMNKVGCKYITLDNYDIKQDRPDIFIASYYSSSNPEINFPGVHEFVGSMFAAIPNVVMNEKDNNIHWDYISNAYKYMEPDFYLCERPVFNSLKDYISEGKLVEVGNPQYDEIFREVGRNHPIPQAWEKLNGKKIFLWATDHGINESYPANGFTVDLYLGEMLRYFAEHEDLGLIFRPHPEFIREMLLKGHFWNEADVAKFKDYCNSTSNVVWDDTHDYCCAFDLCDAFIVDLNCSITCAALTTGKPICRLQRTDIFEWEISHELHDCYYYARGFDELQQFINIVIENNDCKIKSREDGVKKSILHFDGQNGERMKFVITELAK